MVFSPFFVPDARAAHQEKSSCAIQFKRHVLNTSWTVCTRASASSKSENTNVTYGKATGPQCVGSVANENQRELSSFQRPNHNSFL